MGIYVFEVEVKLPDGVAVADAEVHISDAVACYAGTLPPEDLFSHLDREAVIVRNTKRPVTNRLARWYIIKLNGEVHAGPFATKKATLARLERALPGIPRTRRLRRECYVITAERSDGSITESLCYVATVEGARSHEVELKWPSPQKTRKEDAEGKQKES